MLISQTPVARTSGSTVTRMLEQKRAVEQMPDPGSAVARLNLLHKYMDIFSTILAQHQTEPEAPQPPSFPIEV